MKKFLAVFAVAVLGAQAWGEVPPVMTEDVKVQTIGAERLLEDLPPGLIFIDEDSGELFFSDENNKHGRAVCMCRGLPDWHSFTNTVHLNGNRMDFNQYYSIQAEASALTIRYGTNAIWRILGDSQGELADLTAELTDPNTLRLQAAAAGDGVVLECCTNLLEAGAWEVVPAATIVEETDVSTTWEIDLTGANAFFYRVRANVQRAQGVYAERQLVAEQGIKVGKGYGIEMGGELRTNWPTADDLNLRYWLCMRGLCMPSSPEEGISVISGFGNYFSLEECLWNLPGDWPLDFKMISTNKTWDFQTPTAPKWNGAPLATLAAVSNSVSNVTARVDSLSDVVSAIAADYVTSSDIADFATTQAVASVERRLARLANDTCTLFWSTNTILSAEQSTYYIPTNFPTRRLKIYVFGNGVESLSLVLGEWNPGREVEIELETGRDSARSSSNPLAISVANNGATTVVHNNTATVGIRSQFRFLPEAGRWVAYAFQALNTARAQSNFAWDFSDDTTTGQEIPDSAPATVEAWLALHPEWAASP